MAGLFLLGLAFRLPGLDTCSLWLDEAWRVAVAEAPLPTPIESPGEWLERIFSFHGLLRMIFAAVGQSEWSVRIIPAVAGAATVTATYYLGRLVLDRLVGVLAALIVCLNPLHVAYSQEGAAYSISGLLVPVFLAVCVRLRDVQISRFVVAALVLLSALMGLSFLYQLGFAAVVLILYAASAANSWSSMRTVVLFGLFAALGGLLLMRYEPWLRNAAFTAQPLDEWMMSYPARLVNSVFSGPLNESQGGYFLRDYYAPSVGPEASQAARVFGWVALVMGGGALLNGALAFVKSNEHARIWSASLAAYVAFLLLQALLTKHAQVRYIVPVLPILALFIAGSLAQATRKHSAVGMGMVCTLLVHYALVMLNDPPGHRWKPDVRSIAQAAVKDARDGRGVVLINPEVFEVPLYDFYLRESQCLLLRQPAYEEFFHRGNRAIQYRTAEAKEPETVWLRDNLLRQKAHISTVYLVSQRDKQRVVELAAMLADHWPRVETSEIDHVLVIKLGEKSGASGSDSHSNTPPDS